MTDEHTVMVGISRGKVKKQEVVNTHKQHVSETAIYSDVTPYNLVIFNISEEAEIPSLGQKTEMLVNIYQTTRLNIQKRVSS